MYVDIFKDQQRLHRHDNPSPFALLGWLGYLDGKQVTHLVLSTSTVSLNMAVEGKDVILSFSGDQMAEKRTVTVPRPVATEMALYFLKNEGLPPELSQDAE